MNTADFDYDLPPHLIAQQPAEPRDTSRLLVLNRRTGAMEHHRFHDIGAFLRPGDLLVVNDTRVLRARLHGVKRDTGGHVELLLLHEVGARVWEALVRPARGMRPGTALSFGDGAVAAVIESTTDCGGRVIRFDGDTPVLDLLQTYGEVPLPPYIRRPVDREEQYQTVYAKHPGSAAAPTAGLHFTPQLLTRLQTAGVRLARVTLHVGIGTFRPIAVDSLDQHVMHEEEFWIPPQTADLIAATRRASGRIVAVGTTTVRALESASEVAGAAGSCGRTRLFITPGYEFKSVDALITNFHLPRSTLLVMVSAFAGRERILTAYREAVQRAYRFYSFGDAMLIC